MYCIVLLLFEEINVLQSQNKLAKCLLDIEKLISNNKELTNSKHELKDKHNTKQCDDTQLQKKINNNCLTIQRHQTLVDHIKKKINNYINRMEVCFICSIIKHHL